MGLVITLFNTNPRTYCVAFKHSHCMFKSSVHIQDKITFSILEIHFLTSYTALSSTQATLLCVIMKVSTLFENYICTQFYVT